jgi:hypothetical protein
MAQTEHLPIYKAAYDCCLYFEQLVRNFSGFNALLNFDANAPNSPERQ